MPTPVIAILIVAAILLIYTITTIIFEDCKTVFTDSETGYPCKYIEGSSMPFDKMIDLGGGNYQMCHTSGKLLLISSEWHTDYINPNTGKSVLQKKKEPPEEKIEKVRRLIRTNFSDNKVSCKLKYLGR